MSSQPSKETSEEEDMSIEDLRKRLSIVKGRHKKSEGLLRKRASERQEEIAAHALELNTERTLKINAEQRATTLQEKLDDETDTCATVERENEELHNENEKLRNENKELNTKNEKLRNELANVSKPSKRKLKHEDEEYSPPPKTLKKATSGHFIMIPRDAKQFTHKGGNTYKHNVDPDTYIERYNDGDKEFGFNDGDKEFASRKPFKSTSRVNLLDFSYRCVLT